MYVNSFAKIKARPNKALVLGVLLTSLFVALIAFNNFVPVRASSTVLNFQGKIVNKTTGVNVTAGSPACVVSGASNDTCDFRANIYDDPSAGTLRFREPHSNIEVENYNGVFNLRINSVCASWSAPGGSCSGTGVDWTTGTYYLEIQIDTDGDGDFASGGADTLETFSRKEVDSAAYSQYASNAGQLNGITDTGFVKFAPSSGQTTALTNSLINLTTTGNTSNALLFLNENGAGTPNVLQLQVASSNVLVLNNSGQLQLATQGSTGGLLLGGDADLYRSGTNALRTSESLTVDNTLTASSNFTVTTGAVNITGTSGSTALTGYGTTSITSTSTSTAFTFNSNSVQTNTGLALSSTGLTTGKALTLSATNTAITDVAINPITVTLTNAQGTTANTNSYTGVNFTYNHTPTVATATETVGLISLASNTGSPTDTTVASLLRLENLDTATGNSITVADGLLVQSTTAALITDGVDVSDAELDNAINVGDNFILGNGIRQFSSSSTVWTVEDTSGNDLITITDGGTAGQLAVPGQGNTFGILIGGDTQLYRTSADVLRTPDALTVDSTLTASSNFTVTTGAVNITGTSGAIALTGYGTTSITSTSTSNAFVFNSNSVQTNTGTTLSSTGLTTGKALSVTATNTAVTDVAINPITFTLTNAQGTTANTNSYTGFNFTYNHTPTVATATETVGLISLASNTGSPTDTTVASLLRLENLDTATGNSITVADGLLVQSTTSALLTDGVDVSDAEIDNAINVGDNFILGNGIRQFSSSATVWTFEDISGNDLLTITDSGTTGTIAANALTISGLTTNKGILYTNGSGVVTQISAPGASQCLQTDGSSNFTWGSCGGSGPWTDAGSYLYPTSGEFLGNNTSGGSNKLAGIYLADNAPAYFGTDNDLNFVYNSSTNTLDLNGTGSNDPRLKFIDPGSHSFTIGTTNNTNQFLIIDGDVDTLFSADGTTNGIDINGHTALGSGASVSTHSVLNVDESFTSDGSNNKRGLLIDVDQSGAAASNGFLGIDMITSISPGGGNTVQFSRGLSDVLKMTGAGTLTDAFSIYSRVDNTSTGTITRGYGMYVATATNSGGGSIGTNYGIYVGNQTVGTSDYGLYIEGADTRALWVDSGFSQFDGNVAIGLTPVSNIVLQIGSTVAMSSGTTYVGVNQSFTYTGANSSAAYGTKISIEVQPGTGNTAATANGIESISGLSSDGTLTLGQGGTFQVTNTSTGTIATAKGINIAATSNSGGGAVTTNYGVFIANQTAGGSDYGLYIAGADTNAIWVDSGTSRFDGFVSIGTNTPQTNHILNIENTFAQSSGTNYMGIYVVNTGTGANSSFLNGIEGHADAKPGSGNTIGTTRGVLGNAVMSTAGTVSNAWGVNGRVDNSSTGTIGAGAGLFVQSATNTGGGTITNNYGLYIENQTAGGGDYGIYIAGADTNAIWVDNGTSRFDGSIAVGTTVGTNIGIQQSQTYAAGGGSTFYYGVNTTNILTGATGGGTGGTVGGEFAGEAQPGGGNTQTWLFGASGIARLTTAGTVTNAYGLISSVNNTSTGTIGEVRGLNINATVNSGGGTVTTNYGIYVNNQTVGTSDYGLYIAGADTNAIFVDSGTSRFDGNVSIGTSPVSGNNLIIAGSTSSSDLIGAKTTNTATGAIAGYIEGFDANVVVSHGSGTVGNAKGYSSNVTFSTAGTVSFAIGYQSLVENTSTGTIDNLYQFHAQAANNTGGGTITNNYGLRVENQTAGTNDYGVYIAGAQTYALFVDSGVTRLDANVEINGNVVCTGCIDQTAIAVDAVGTSELKTATSSTSGAAATNVNMDDYSFFPSMERDDCDNTSNNLQNSAANATDNTVGRFRMTLTCTSGTWDVRWRSVTASDRPTIWAIANNDGTMVSLREAEDPIGHNYPENPNPYEDSLSSGQHYASIPVISVAQLEVMYNSLPESDKQGVTMLLRDYIVNRRGWLAELNSVSDLTNVTERFNEAARHWGLRFIADYYGLSRSELMMTTLTLDSNDNFVVPNNYYLVLSNHLQERQSNLDAIANNAFDEQLTQQLDSLSVNNFDLAEEYEVSDSSIEAGDVVRLDKDSTNNLMLERAGGLDSSYDNEVFGVISTAPGIYLNNWKENNLNGRPVALAGRVPVKVTDENGEIKKGDYLTTSSKPGYAMKATKGGMIIGRALEDFPNSETPGDSNEVQNELTDDINYVSTIITAMDNSYEETNSEIDEVIDYMNSTLQIQSDALAGEGRIMMNVDTGFLSGEYFGLANNSINIIDDNGANLGSLFTLVDDTLVLEKNLEVQGAVSANKFAALNLQDLVLQINDDKLFKIVDSSDSVIFAINSSGKITLREGVDSSVGKATIAAGNTEVFVSNKSITENSRIQITPDQLVTYRVKNKLAGYGFTIEIDSSLLENVNFEYFLVN